jgi:hypothetical protein
MTSPMEGTIKRKRHREERRRYGPVGRPAGGTLLQLPGDPIGATAADTGRQVPYKFPYDRAVTT